MSPPRLDPNVVVEFTVEEGLDVGWDEPRIGALVCSIVTSELPPLGGSYLVGLHLVDDATIRKMNAEHRGQDVQTDVLSFPLHDPNGAAFVVPANQPVNLGDVVVSHSRAVEQAAEFGHSTDREIGYLVAHGVLHVLGYDHEAEADRRHMRQREEGVLRPLGFLR